MTTETDLDERLLFNQKTTALLLGVKPQALQQWDVKPCKRRGREAFYYWPDVLAERDVRYWGEYDDEPEIAEVFNLDHERARHSKEQADKLALENAALRGDVAYVEEIAMVMGQALGAFRARLLAAASKLAPLVNPGNPDVARDLIEREHSEALAELADFDPQAEPAKRAANGERTVRDAQAAAEVDSQPVGGRRKKTQR